MRIQVFLDYLRNKCKLYYSTFISHILIFFLFSYSFPLASYRATDEFSHFIPNIRRTKPVWHFSPKNAIYPLNIITLCSLKSCELTIMLYRIHSLFILHPYLSTESSGYTSACVHDNRILLINV